MRLDCLIKQAASMTQPNGTGSCAASTPQRARLFCMSRIGTILFLIFLLRISTFAANPNDIHIIFLTSVNPDKPGIAALIEETRIGIQSTVERPAHFDIEYLEPELSGENPATNATTTRYLRDKYSRERFELIIAIGTGALRVAEDQGDRLFPGAKIISVLLNSSPNNAEPVSPATVAAFYVMPDFSPTVETALEQNPGTQQLVLVAGSSPNDQLQLEWAKANLAVYASRLKLLTLTDCTPDQLKQKLSSLDSHSIALFIDFTADNTGGQYVGTRVLRNLAQSASRPIYGTLSEQIGSGAVGGSVIDMREAGRIMGKTAAQFLHDEKKQNALVWGAKQQHYIFDARELRRRHISRLPPSSQILNEGPVSWTLHDGRFIGLALAVCLETLLIVFLFKTTFRRMRVERYLARLLIVVRLESRLATNIINMALGFGPTETNNGIKQFSKLIGIDCISIYEVRQETSQFRLLGYSSMRGTRLRLSRLQPSEFKQTADKLLSGQSVVARTVADIPQESAGIMSELGKSGLHSFAGIPVFVDKRVVGALFFSSSKEPDWADTLLGELQLVADMVGSGLDRARVHASLARSEQLKSAILSSLPASVVVLDHDGRVIDFNCSPTTASECDFDQTSLSPGADYRELCRKAVGEGSNHAQAALDGLQSILSGMTTNFELEYPRRSTRRECWTRMHVVPLSAEQGGVVVTLSDVTDRKLAELEREQLATARGELSGRLLRAQEEERARVARELHDDINQKLCLLAVDIKTLQQSPPETREEIFNKLQGFFRTTSRISADIQRLSHRLHSHRLDYLGLAVAARRLCTEFTEQHEIAVEYLIENVPRRLSREIELALFRIVQECLTNIARHSSATRAVVRLRYLEENMSMTVSDNGTGFSLTMKDMGKEPGLGLVSMRERLRLINGDLAIHSEPGSGTKIIVSVPLQEEHFAENTDPGVERKRA